MWRALFFCTLYFFLFFRYLLDFILGNVFKAPLNIWYDTLKKAHERTIWFCKCTMTALSNV